MCFNCLFVELLFSLEMFESFLSFCFTFFVKLNFLLMMMHYLQGMLELSSMFQSMCFFFMAHRFVVVSGLCHSVFRVFKRSSLRPMMFGNFIISFMCLFMFYLFSKVSSSFFSMFLFVSVTMRLLMTVELKPLWILFLYSESLSNLSVTESVNVEGVHRLLDELNVCRIIGGCWNAESKNGRTEQFR